MNAVSPWVKDDRDEKTLKQAFAGALLRHPNNPYEAGRILFPQDHTRALTAAQLWVSDPFVLGFQQELIEEHGEDHFLPSKVILARSIWELGENPRASVTERLAAKKLYAEVRGFITRPDTVVGNVTINQNRVMVIPSAGSDDEWETKLASQQAKLIEHSRD